MTCIVQIQTKKELKETIEDGGLVYIEDPSIVNPRTFSTSEIKEDEVITVTNHPKRSYFAIIERKNGKLKVR